MSKIKILFIIDFIYGLQGGTENQLIKIVNNLNSAKYDVHLLCLRNTNWINTHVSRLNCKVKCCDIVRLRNPKNIFWFTSIFQCIKNLKPNIVITFFPLSNILGVIIARMAGVRTIVSTRRDYGLWLGSRGLSLLHFANRFVSRILVNSQKVKELTGKKEKFDYSKIEVIYNGINVDGYSTDEETNLSLKAKIGIPLGAPIVGIVAGLKPMKRHETFLKAAKLVLESHDDVFFVIVGDGILRKNLERLSNHLGVSNHIRFVGNQENVVPFLQIFDLGVNCSANEGLSNAIMEYMTYGVPCIVSNAGGNPELIEHGVNGYTFELDNSNQLADLVVNLLNDMEKQEEFVAKSRDLISERFGLQRMINEYDRCFTQIIQNNS